MPPIFYSPPDPPMRLPVLLLIPLFLAACTTSFVPAAKEVASLPPDSRLDADDTFTVAVAAPPEVVITADELARSEATLQKRIARATARTRADGNARDWKVLLLLSRYDHGDANKRRLRAGMGAMYIDAQVTLLAADGSTAGEFPASRSYAWGGEMGAAATIADLEVMLGDYLGRELASENRLPPGETSAAAAGADGEDSERGWKIVPRNKAMEHAPIR